MDKQLHSLALRCTSNTYNRKRPDCLLSDSPATDSPHNSEAFIEIPLKAREKKMNCPVAITIQESDYLKNRHSSVPLFCRETCVSALKSR